MKVLHHNPKSSYCIHLFIVFVMVTLLSLSACSELGFTKIIHGSGNLISEVRPVSGISQISVEDGLNVILTQGESENLEIIGDDNIVPYIETMQTGEQLKIGYRHTGELLRIIPSSSISIKLGVIKLDQIDVSGGSALTCDDLSGNEMVINASGAGTVSIEHLQSNKLSMNLSGASQAWIAGELPYLDLSMSGGGSFEAGDLKVENGTFNISGGGQVTIWMTGTLNAILSGGSHIYYYGRPLVTQDSSGGSNATPLGDK